jgi:hypothetical protein
MNKFIKQNFPVIRKRSALWFFSNQPAFSPAGQTDKKQQPAATNNGAGAATTTKLSRNKILQLWKNLDPESKRKYFNMAEFDKLRYEEQKSRWVSEVGLLLQKYGILDQVTELAPSREELQSQFLTSLEKLQKSYEQMIQTESTKMLYKDTIKRIDGYTPVMDSEELISSVPKHHRAILTKPRRPPPAFVLYLNDNMDRYKQIRSETKTKDSCMRLCANEWNELDEETRLIYEQRYDKLKDDYDKAMETYRRELAESNDSYLQMASREKKAFKRSLRRRLRESSLLPVSIRNAFNFFVMDNKDAKLSDLTQTWRDLPMEEKVKYFKMYREDVIRYQREIETFNELRKTLNEIVGRRKNWSSSRGEREKKSTENQNNKTSEFHRAESECENGDSASR